MESPGARSAPPAAWDAGRASGGAWRGAGCGLPKPRWHRSGGRSGSREGVVGAASAPVQQLTSLIPLTRKAKSCILMNVHSISGVIDCSSQSASPFLIEWNNLLKDHRYTRLLNFGNTQEDDVPTNPMAQLGCHETLPALERHTMERPRMKNCRTFESHLASSSPALAAPPRLLFARKEVAYQLILSIRAVDYLIADGGLKRERSVAGYSLPTTS